MGLIALAIQLIIDFDVIKISKGKELIPAHKQYRRFLISLMVFYVADALWGVIYDNRIMLLARIITTIFFASVAMSVFLWTRYVIVYLDSKEIFGKLLSAFGWLFALVETIVLIANEFYPLVFYCDENNEYVPCHMRYTMLNVQVALFFTSAVYSLFESFRADEIKRHRFLTIGISGLAFTVLITEQTKYPLLPLYSVGCIISVCIIHRFVVEEEKNDYSRELEILVEKEKKQLDELTNTKVLVHTDALTGVKSKFSYMETEAHYDDLIKSDESPEFAILCFDLNDLKKINDRYGHDRGDELIKAACKIICKHFAHSPVYRTGGDEFSAVLQGQDYDNRILILNAFNLEIEENMKNKLPVIAAGMQEFDPSSDYRFGDVYRKADKNMYIRKEELKEKAREILKETT